MVGLPVPEEPDQPEGPLRREVEGEDREQPPVRRVASLREQRAAAAEVTPPDRRPFPGGEDVAGLRRQRAPLFPHRVEFDRFDAHTGLRRRAPEDSPRDALGVPERELLVNGQGRDPLAQRLGARKPFCR